MTHLSPQCIVLMGLRSGTPFHSQLQMLLNSDGETMSIALNCLQNSLPRSGHVAF